jgi:hypothetical protein
MHCHLLIPDLFSDEETRPGTRAAAAETLIARGRRKRSAAVSRETWLFERFAVQKQRDWPVAPYTLLADGGAPELDFWMRADPVHLRVSHNGLILAGDSAFDVSHEEAAALIETLNRHFGEDMVFQAIEPTRWHVRLPQAPDMQTMPHSHARGAPIAGQLPSGPDALLFQARMNETQMLFQEYPVNERAIARRAGAEQIWFGAGTMESPVFGPRRYSPTILSRAVSRYLRSPSRPLYTPVPCSPQLAARASCSLIRPAARKKSPRPSAIGSSSSSLRCVRDASAC